MAEWLAEVQRLTGYFGPEERKYLEVLYRWGYISTEAAQQLTRKRSFDGKEELE